MSPVTWFESKPGAPAFVGASTRESKLRSLLLRVEGIQSVRVLPADARSSLRDKIYVVLGTHDVERDRRVVEILCQIDDVDFDFVPIEAQGMIPDEATELRTLS